MVRGQKVEGFRKVKFKISLTEGEAADYARVLEKLGIRRKGQKLSVQTEHGWIGEKGYNRQGFAKGARYAVQELVKREAAIDAERQELIEKAKRLGMPLASA